MSRRCSFRSMNVFWWITRGLSIAALASAGITGQFVQEQKKNIMMIQQLINVQTVFWISLTVQSQLKHQGCNYKANSNFLNFNFKQKLDNLISLNSFFRGYQTLLHQLSMFSVLVLKNSTKNNDHGLICKCSQIHSYSSWAAVDSHCSGQENGGVKAMPSVW